MVLLNAVVIVGCGGGLRPSCRVGTFAGPSDLFAPTELSRGRQGGRTNTVDHPDGGWCTDHLPR